MTKKNKSTSLFDLRSLGFFNLIISERNFLLFVSVLFLMAGLFSPYPSIAMWFGFAVAGYSSVANDSIQTIGTFIVSNKTKKPGPIEKANKSPQGIAVSMSCKYKFKSQSRFSVAVSAN